jgi:putative endopeptidase
MSVDALREFTDDNVRPQDDLFGHVNGRWLETAEVPSDLPMTGGFIDLRQQAEADVGDILRVASDAAADGSAAPGTNRQRIGDLFASFMADERIESLGYEPIAADLAAIDEVTDTRALVRLLGRLARDGMPGALGSYVDTDDRQSDRYVINLVQAGIGLPDESYYSEESFAAIREAYVSHVAAMFRLVGWDDAAAEAGADRVMALETRLAAGHWDRVRSRDVLATYNLTTLDELRAAAPGFDWTGWIGAMGASESAFAEVVVRQPEYLAALSSALEEVPLADWKAWATFHLVSDAASLLSAAFVDQNFAFYARTLTGTEELRDRWKRGVDLCNGALGEAVGEEYVARRFPAEAKAQIDALVDNLLAAYRVSIGQLEWMTADTRARALTKLDKFRPKIGHPVRWRDYSALEIVRDDLVGNARRAAAFETDRQLAKIGSPVDLDEWLITPQTVNAYYNPGVNEICFPAAILQPPFFDPDTDPALNYGGIGAVIGHEIGHGFDDQGSRYDGDGNLENWWTDDDRTRFSERADRLIAQYDGFEPRLMPGQHVNGALTVGENIGDLGGLTIALLAYDLSLDGDEAPVIDGFGGRERLFHNWGRIWRIKTRPELAAQLLTVDPHSPAEFRANIVRNLDEFHETFGTDADDGLWLDPEERVRIW